MLQTTPKTQPGGWAQVFLRLQYHESGWKKKPISKLASSVRSAAIIATQILAAVHGVLFGITEFSTRADLSVGCIQCKRVAQFCASRI